ncbi:MAG TPA: hypothetical protein VIC63_03745 [Candidatus Limnocylindria bacterium]|jgi:hypothetical protein
MVPWAIWTVLVAAINLTLFVALRGRWGREAPALVIAALIGTALGNFVASLVQADILVLGEYHVVGAAIGAQVALIVTSAAATLLAPTGSAGRRDGAGSGR